ncbi:hypothetical protein RHMOL_Rhmol02G0186700 [Rhododendron molle]|uniref:Uncharacterized protein n=1 Tax=Rhododendron molle TaxID=49168 RepID=A0ACC0PS36_RHOML|nr:hypothetical protein RHMOL_Rhmol02G0186700 [Rhododendron molle]
MEQQFDNLDDVFKFYNNYAKQVGFSVRIHSSKVKDGEIIRKEYVCYKQGKRTPKSSENSEAPTIRRRGIIRTDCRAKLSVVRNNIGEGFVVIQFLEAHNHELTSPRRVHLLPSHRRMSAAARSLTKDLAAANVPPCQQMAILEVQAGGVENIGFTNRDLHNSDRNNRKKYAGVNHHGQTTLFGCAFLNEETTESFEWLLKEWLKAMPGGPPKMIITDQDPAMTKAIGNVLPNTLHRYCIWHITKKFSEKLGAVIYKEHYDKFSSCIWESERPEEFDVRWGDLLRQIDLTGHGWLNDLFEIRGRWIPAYTRHIFSAGMTSSQRAENNHAFFKRFVSKHNSLLDFVTRFERGISRIRHNELDFDHKDANERPQMKTMFLMEKRMSEVYTLPIFQKFQDEIFQNSAYLLTMKHEDEHCRLWDVKREDKVGSRSREVSVDKTSNHVSCSCKMFECEGIPCRHMLAYFFRMGIRELPTEYICTRWTKTAKASRVMDDLRNGANEICGTSLLMRRQGLFQLASNVIDDAILDEEGTKVLQEGLEALQKQIAAMRISRQDGGPSATDVPISLGSQHRFKEPEQIRAKGCGKRLQGGKERAVNKKSRKCNGCGLTGQSHDKRNCPKLLNISSQDVDDEDDMDYEDLS